MSESQQQDRWDPPCDALPEEWNDWDESASEAWEELAENNFDEPEPDWDWNALEDEDY